MAIRLGGAILGIPVIFLLVGFFGWGLSEIAFLGTGLIEGYGDGDDYDWNDDGCMVKDERKFCKNNFGLFGWKQWFSNDETNIVEKTIETPVKALDNVTTDIIEGKKSSTSEIVFEDDFRICTMKQGEPPVCEWK